MVFGNRMVKRISASERKVKRLATVWTTKGLEFMSR
jgi:hypothetical protein